MAYTDFIAAIDLGSSHMVGMVGVKNANGSLTVVNYAEEDSSSCIRRGCVYNVKDTAFKIKRLIGKLESKLDGVKIGKVYIGLGGQSIRSIDHTVSKVLGTEGVVTEELIKSLDQECQNFHPDMLNVLAIDSPSYYLDNRYEPNPVGVSCSRIEARYKIIIGRPSLRTSVINSVAEQANIEVAGILVSPLALADVKLGDNEKDLGCALIDFGAGVTSVTVYKNGKLNSLTVIPLGSNLITRDIMSLHVVEAEAERLKVTYGRTKNDKDTDLSVQVSLAEGYGLREIKMGELNNVVEARANEILENVYARLEATGLTNALGAGVVITGGGAALKGLAEAMRERLKVDVHFSPIRKGVLSNSDMILSNNPEYAVAIGLLKKGTQNCASYVPPKPEPTPTPIDDKQPEKDDNENKGNVKQPVEPPKPSKKKGWWKTITRKAEDLGRGLFDENEETMSNDNKKI